MAQIDIDKFVISLMRYFGNNKEIATTLDRCLFSLGLKYIDTPTGGRLERVDQPTMLEKIMWESGEQKAIKHNNDATIDSNLNDYCCKVYNALYKENNGNLSFERLQHLAMDIYKWCKEQQTPAEWSEEDEKIYQSIMDDTVQENQLGSKQIAWLKSIKDRVQPKQEWSEEDRTTRNALIKLVEMLYDSSIYKSDKNRLLDWLKSLRPQNTWKPSATDIIVLEGVIDRGINPINYHATLHGILEQLKKLREE